MQQDFDRGVFVTEKSQVCQYEGIDTTARYIDVFGGAYGNARMPDWPH